MQISYHFALTKIQKLQNLKKKKKTFFFCTGWYCRNWPVQPVFFPVRNRGVIRTGLLVGTVYSDCTDRYGMKLTPLIVMGLTGTWLLGYLTIGNGYEIIGILDVFWWLCFPFLVHSSVWAWMLVFMMEECDELCIKIYIIYHVINYTPYIFFFS